MAPQLSKHTWLEKILQENSGADFLARMNLGRNDE
jgi:hypothetical protein